MKIFSILFIIFSTFLFIGWDSSPYVNTPICTASGWQEGPQIIPDGSGGTVIAWYDRRAGNIFDIYAQRMDPEGNPLWNVNGVAICQGTNVNSFNELQLAMDDIGNVIITWFDIRNGESDIYAQKVNPNGNLLWNLNGVSVCSAVGHQQNSKIISDGSNGAIIVWEDYRGEVSNIYAQRIDSTGNPLWVVDGLPVCKNVNKQLNPSIIQGGSGGAIIVWEDYQIGNSDIYAQRVDSNGNPLWAVNGVCVRIAPNNQYSPRIIPDGTGGAIIVWEDYQIGNSDIYAQRVNSSGQLLWADGVAICSDGSNQSTPVITPDGEGGAVIAWRDYRSEWNCNIYAQRVDSNGSPLWTENGIAITIYEYIGYHLQIITDGRRGIFITFNVGCGDNYDIYAQYVDFRGNLPWGIMGKVICAGVNSQDKPQIVPDRIAGAIITWEDYRSRNLDIYAQKVMPDGKLGNRAFLIFTGISGGNGTVTPGVQQVNHGNNAIININPDPGYRISSIMDNGISVPVANPCTITNITSDHSIIVSFSIE